MTKCTKLTLGKVEFHRYCESCKNNFLVDFCHWPLEKAENTTFDQFITFIENRGLKKTWTKYLFPSTEIIPF